MKTPEETQAYVEVALLSEGTRDLIKSRLRDHLCYIMNSKDKTQQEAIENFLNDFKKLGLA